MVQFHHIKKSGAVLSLDLFDQEPQLLICIVLHSIALHHPLPV